MASTVKSLRALADPTRLRMLLVLCRDEVTVAELQEILGMRQSRISAALGLLKRTGLATDRRVGKNIFYSAVSLAPGITGLLDAARREIPEAEADAAALALVRRKRKDKAAEYFNRLAGRFGRTYVPGRSWQALAHALFPLVPPLVIADLGAGEGTLAQLFARRAKRVIAVDISEKMVEFGTNLACEHGLKNIDYRLGDIEEPPIEDASVDLVLFSQTLHHTPNPRRALEAAARILKPGGRIVILDLAAHTFEQARELYAHAWLGFSEAGIDGMLKRAGFSGIETSIVSREEEPPHFRTLLATATKEIARGGGRR